MEKNGCQILETHQSKSLSAVENCTVRGRNCHLCIAHPALLWRCGVSTPSLCTCAVCLRVDFLCCDDLSADANRSFHALTFIPVMQPGEAQSKRAWIIESVDFIFFFNMCSFVAASKKVLWKVKWQLLCSACVCVCVLRYVWQACEILLVMETKKRSQRVTKEPLVFYSLCFSQLIYSQSGSVSQHLWRTESCRGFFPHTDQSETRENLIRKHGAVFVWRLEVHLILVARVYKLQTELVTPPFECVYTWKGSQHCSAHAVDTGGWCSEWWLWSSLHCFATCQRLCHFKWLALFSTSMRTLVLRHKRTVGTVKMPSKVDKNVDKYPQP